MDIAIEFSEEYPLDLDEDEGMIGSPIISIENKLLGVVNTNCSMLKSQCIFTLLQEELLLPVLTPKTSLIETIYFQPTTSFLDNENNILLFYSLEEAVCKAIQCVEMISGSTAISTQYGIIVCGLTSQQQALVWLYDGKTIRELPPTMKKHLYHSCVAINNLLYVISGSTTAVEIYDFTTNCWTFTTPFTKRRCNATAVYANYVYVIGGKRENKLLSSILKLKNDSWIKIKVKLPQKIFSCGCLVFNKELLVFGGTTSDGKNAMSYRINVKKYTISEEKYSIVQNFGRSSALYLNDEVLFYSNEKILFKYDCTSSEIYKISLDQEEVTLTS